MAYMADALGDMELGTAFARLWNPKEPLVQRFFGSCGARIYWCDSPGALPWLLDAAEKYHPEPHPQGHHAYPFAAMNFHRRNQWVASVRGWSRYVWNYETLDSENRYGRYSSYGMIQIFSKGEPVTPEASGYREEGWDWTRPPGATVIRLASDDLPSPKYRIYTADPFVGGVALEHSQGLWAMRFTDPYYEKSFCFRKSAFFVDDTIVCLGSGISNSDTSHTTETVLYQTALQSAPPRFPAREARPVRWMTDPVGNGYYFPEAPVVQTRLQHQLSMAGNGEKKTEGNFAVAWLDHGLAPANAGYSYAIRPDTTGKAMQRFAAAPDFEVLRRDSAAHIVRFPGKRIVAYALFGPIENMASDALRGVESSCLVMTRHDGDRLIVAVADPDLRLGQPTMTNNFAASQPGGESRLRLHLNGSWQLAAAAYNVRALNDHTLEILCCGGASNELVLRQH